MEHMKDGMCEATFADLPGPSHGGENYVFALLTGSPHSRSARPFARSPGPKSEYREIWSQIESIMEHNEEYLDDDRISHIARHQLLSKWYGEEGQRDRSELPKHLQGQCRECHRKCTDWVEASVRKEKKKKSLPGYYVSWDRHDGSDCDRRWWNRREARRDGLIVDFDDPDFDSDEYMYY